jgi:polysaccharide biosynthesis protein PslH
MSPHILFLTHVSPLPAVSGERMRSYNLMKGLAACGWRVSLFSLDPNALVDDPARRELASLCDSVIVEPLRKAAVRRYLRVLEDTARGKAFQLRYFYDEQAARRLRDHLVHVSYDAIQVCQLYMHKYLPPATTVPVIFDSVNAESRRIERIARTTPLTARGVVARLQVGAVRSMERAVAQESAAVLAVSEIEAGYFVEELGARATVVPNGVDLARWPNAVALPKEARVLLMGSMNYSANADSVLHFLDDIAPHLRHEDVRVTIVGIGPPRSVRAAAMRSPLNVDMMGFVTSTRPYLQSCRVLAVPLRHGAGTRLKILEALAAGVPVVSTTVGAEGLGLEHGREIAIADDPAEFARWVDRLLDDDDLARELGRAGRERVSRDYAWSSIVPKLDALLRGLVSNAEAVQPEAGFTHEARPVRRRLT